VGLPAKEAKVTGWPESSARKVYAGAGPRGWFRVCTAPTTLTMRSNAATSTVHRNARLARYRSRSAAGENREDMHHELCQFVSVVSTTLIRHAIAEDGDDDFARPLSGEGRRRFRKSVETLERVGVRFSKVLHSPKRRALETAELLRPLCDGEFEVTPLLTHSPGDELLELLDVHELAVVGHEPHLSALLAWLVLGDAELAPKFELKKGGVARLEGDVEPGGMRLLALWTPRVLR
jgi:phosphohistidine phosphatase